MGRGDNRKTRKVRRLLARKKLKLRRKKRIEAGSSSK